MIGCGGGKAKTYPAGGKVAFQDGKPLPGGWVSFRAVDSGTMSQGDIQPDGTFELTTRKTGRWRRRRAASSARRGSAAKTAYPGPDAPPPLPPIDPRFAGFETSGLEFTVTTNPSENRFEIEVDRPGKAR